MFKKESLQKCNFILLNTICLVCRLPGNTRTKIGFITFDSTIHFYSLQEGLSQPQMLIVSDIEGMGTVC